MHANLSHTAITGLIAGLTLFLPQAANADTSSEEIMAGFDMSPEEMEALERGEILTYSDKAYEFTKRQLAADSMLKVNASMGAILKALQDDPTLIPNDLTKAHAIIKSEADFDGVEYGPEELEDVDALFEAEPGKDLNFSDSEYAILQKTLRPYRNATDAERINAASDAMRAILVNRYNDYRARGLQGVASYARSRGKQVDVGAELQLTTDTLKAFEGELPEFVRVMTGYPQGADCCEHIFRWVKVRIRKRPGFALTHTIIRTTDDYVILAERVFYVSNQLNSLQITTVWLPYEGGGHLGLAMTASADVLDSMMGRMLRKVGRNMAKDVVEGVMKETKADLESLDSTQ
jgi:hypothetical protein